MITTTVAFDYGTEEFIVRIHGEHVDPETIEVEHRGTFSTRNASTGPWLHLSTQRMEIRHEGIDEDELEEIEEALLDAELAEDLEEFNEWVRNTSGYTEGDLA